MEQFILIAAGGLLTVVLCLTLGKQNKEITILLTVAVVCMITAQMLSYLQPVVDFISTLAQLGQLDSKILAIMLKAIGIGVVAEIAELICVDSGNAAIGKTIQLLASVTVLYIALPLMRSLMEMIQKMLGGI